MVGADAKPPATIARGFYTILRRKEVTYTVLHYMKSHHTLVVPEKFNVVEWISRMWDTVLPEDAILTSVNLEFISLESFLILCGHQTKRKD